MIKRLLLSGAVALALGGAAHAQANNSNTWQTPGNQTVGGAVTMCPGATGIAVPCNAPASGTVAAGYPPNSTPQANSFSGADTTTQALAIAGAAGKFSYLCGFRVDGLGATALANVTVTVGGFIPGASLSMSFIYTFPLGATIASAPLIQAFSPCLEGAGLGNAITLTVPGAGGNTQTNINIWGYQQ